MVGDELVDHFVEGIAYTILPFASLSALALLAALAVLSRHEELEEENRLAGLREVYYQGLRQEQAQVRALRHDMRNHLSALLGLLEQGSWEEAERYLRQLGGSQPSPDTGASAVMRPWMWSLPPRPPPWRRRG